MEFVGALPLLALGALACVQALLVACALLFAQTAVDRAARGASKSEIANSVPSGWKQRLSVRSEAGAVSVQVTAPAVLPGAGAKLRVTARAQEQPT